MKFFMIVCITFISHVSGKTFIIKTVDEGFPQINKLEAGEEYSEDDKDNENNEHNENEDHEPSGYKETKDSMESKGFTFVNLNPN